MNSLFGVELPASVTFIIAFVIVLALIGATFWLVRRFGAARLAAGRGRQPRLAVIDAAAIDSRRKLIIIRRDNVEHLLMIGGPSDVVVETNIMRAGPANQRDTATSRASVDTLPRAVPLPDTVTWPLQPEPVMPPRADRPRLLAEEPSPPTPPPTPIPAPLRALSEPPARPQPTTDPLMGLAAELSRSKPEAGVRPPEAPRAPLASQYPNGETPIAQAAPTAPTVPAASASVLAADAHLAEMAQRLESALRRPIASGAQSAKSEAPKRAPAGEQKRAESRPSPATNGPTNGGPGNGAQSKNVYENLEQEMASLLGRQSGKT